MIKGYIRKTRPAPWTLNLLKTRQDASKLKKRVWTRPTRKSRLKRNLVRSRRISVRNPIRKMQLREYATEARAFVRELQAKESVCPVWAKVSELRNARRYGWPTSSKITECHHKYGRLGPLLLWKPGWIGLSKVGHRWVHQNVAKARLHGWIAQRGDWNNLDVILRK